METIEIILCSGTTCYVMGGAELLELESQLPPRLKDRCRIRGASCMGFCRDQKNGKPPFVSIDGTLLPSASISSILAALDNM